MAGERASKRRKIDVDSAPVEIQPEATHAPSADTNGTGLAATDSPKATKAPATKKRARRSSAVENSIPHDDAEGTFAENGIAADGDGEHATAQEEGATAAVTPAKGRRRASGASNGTSARKSASKASASIPPPTEDIEMEDAISVTDASQAASMDMDAPRTSGRKRQVSRKLEEAATTPARASPLAGKLRRTPAKRTPAKKASAPVEAVPVDASVYQAETETPVKPTPARRRGRPSATPKRVVAAEIPDSESEDGKTANGQAEPVQQLPEAPAAVAEADEELQAVAEMAASLIAATQRKTPNKTKTPKKASQPPPEVVEQLEVPQTQPEVFLPEDTPDLDMGDTITANTDVDMHIDNAIDDIVFEAEQLADIQKALLGKLTRRSPSKLVGLDAETRKVANLISQTVTAGESNSMVVIGARGSGKTTIVDSILAQQQEKHGECFHVVRLNGFIHTDDRVAIREIWRQLGREMDIEEDSSVKNYADTMTTLLALLSHPSETGQEEDGRIAKSVIIILDEFDLFTTHPRQTLLYNLFDIAQSRKAPLAVLGLTTRYDVAEALEKRVKSRFSHRQVYIPLARTFASFKEMSRSVLSTDISSWNAVISHMLETSPVLNTHLQQHYHTTKSIPALQTSLLLPLSTLPATATSAADLVSHLESALSLCPPLAPPDSNLTLLPALSSLELALLICAARVLIIHDADASTFPLAYDEYKSLASKARIAASAAGALATARVWGQGVARLAWEGLIDKGLVVPVGERARGGQGPCKVDVGLEEIGLAVDAGLEAGNVARWCKEI